MTIDTQELRRKVNSTDIVDHIDLHANIKPFLSELLNRLEAAESARRDDYQNWMTALDRNAELLAKLEAAEKTNKEWLRANAPGGWIDNLRIENEALRARITQMEKQEPVAWIRGRDDHRRRKLSFEKPAKSSPDKFHWSPLYTLPGAQPAPSVPENKK